MARSAAGPRTRGQRVGLSERDLARNVNVKEVHLRAPRAGVSLGRCGAAESAGTHLAVLGEERSVRPRYQACVVHRVPISLGDGATDEEDAQFACQGADKVGRRRLRFRGLLRALPGPESGIFRPSGVFAPRYAYSHRWNPLCVVGELSRVVRAARAPGFREPGPTGRHEPPGAHLLKHSGRTIIWAPCLAASRTALAAFDRLASFPCGAAQRAESATVSASDVMAAPHTAPTNTWQAARVNFRVAIAK